MKLPVFRRKLSSRALAWLCVAALLMSLMPLYILSFYNHACYDDFGYTVLTREVWRETGSVYQTFLKALENTINTRKTWEGNYSSTFLNAIQPAVFHEDLYWISSFVLISFFLAALWYFLRQVLIHCLRTDSVTFWMAYAALAFVMIQFVPCLSEAFFWYTGGMAYTFLWSAMLLRIGVWMAFDRAQSRARSIWLFGLLVLLTVVVGGAKFTTTLFALLVEGLFTLYSFLKKRPKRWAQLAVTVLLMAGFLYCITSPGNAIRAETLNSTVSAPMAVAQAFYFGLALAGSWFSLPLLVVWALVAWQLTDALRGSPFKFGHPVWVTLLCVCLFCAQLAPTLYTGNYIGDGRTINTYFYTFVLMSCTLVLYWLGWYLRKSEQQGKMPAIGSSRRDGVRMGVLAVALVLLIIGGVSHQPQTAENPGIDNVAGMSALRSLLNGEAQAYDEAMDARDEALNDANQPEVVLRPVEEIPDAFMGDALESDNLNYVLHLYADYYDKQRVSVAGEE